MIKQLIYDLQSKESQKVDTAIGIIKKLDRGYL
jgi:hypothetical protein